MSFWMSIKSVFINYTNFSGRASRSEYWYFTLFYIILGIAIEILDNAFFGYSDFGGPFNWLMTVILFLPSLSVSCRRLHDINKSGWWLLLFLTIIGIILLFFWYVRKSDEGENKYGLPKNSLQGS